MQITKLGLEQGYKALTKVIDAYIEQNDISFITDLNAPNNFKDMKRIYEVNKCLCVYSGGDHGHLGREYNIKFRAVHDFMHLKYNLTFSFQDERKLSDITVLEFRGIAADLNINLWIRRILGQIIDAEIKGQIKYYEENKEYVKDQVQFINSYLNVA